ncbi:MAG: hypothetical protein ACE5KW_04115, partial [Dehalococcoidia bacterium]
LALPRRLAGAGLAFALAVVLVVDLADVGVDGDMAQAPAPAAERTSGDEGFEGATDLEMEPTPAAPSGREAAETPAALPSEDGGGLDPLRASEIGLAAALGVLLLGWGSLRLVAVFRRERASP